MPPSWTIKVDNMYCTDVGPANPDIAGIGMIVGFAIQAGLSIFCSFFSLVIWKKATKSQKRSDQYKKKVTDNVLMRFNELALLSGLGLLISGLIQKDKLSLYHFLIVSGIIHFISTSVCVTAVSIADSTPTQGTVRKLSFSAFIILYVVFFIILMTELGRWDESEPGSCVYSEDAQPSGYQLFTGFIYGTEAISLLLVFGYRLWIDKHVRECQSYNALRDDLNVSAPPSTVPPNPMGAVAWIVAMLQTVVCGLGIWLIVQLRALNKGLLSGDSEDTWGFGQTFSVVLAVSNITTCCQEYDSYWKAVRGHSS